MVGSHQIGSVKVDVTSGGVVAVLPQPASTSDRQFRSGVHALGGVWLGHRISFGPDKASRVLDLVRTHYGMEPESDPLGLGPPEPTRFAAVPITIVAPVEDLPEDDELVRLQANLPILEQRERILRERHGAALRALQATRDRVADLAGRS